MKILLDMNIPLKYAPLLEKKGFTVLRWSDVGRANASDDVIMAYARENGFIVLTYDLDFSAMLSATHAYKPSIVQIRATIPNSDLIVELIATAMLQNKDSLASGAILTIDPKKARLRMLPL